MMDSNSMSSYRDEEDWDEYVRLREKFASAAETIDAHKLNVMLGDLWQASSEDFQHHSDTIITHIAALAEEARREAREYQRKVDEKIIERLRAAGGDAVKIMAETIQAQTAENAQLREEVERLTVANEIATALVQPVAEAAAQVHAIARPEDRWHSLTCDGTCSPPCDAAPTAQPTPLEKPDGELGGMGRYPDKNFGKAQPTPPDDELVRKVIDESTVNARAVFDQSCDHTQQAIDYMAVVIEQKLRAALAAKQAEKEA